MKKILWYTFALIVAFFVFTLIFHFSGQRGKTDATLGVDRIFDEWSETQEAVFDSIRQDTSESILLFDRLVLTKEELDRRVKVYADRQLRITGLDPLPANCTMVYELLEFDVDGVKVMDAHGKWHRSMTYGTEPVVHIFKEGSDPALNMPFMSCFLRCLNGYMILKDPTRIAKVAVRVKQVEEPEITVLGVISEYRHPCHIIPDLIGWLLFAEDNNIQVMYKDTTWKYCSIDMVWEKFVYGHKVAIDLPVGTEVLSETSSRGEEVISIGIPNKSRNKLYIKKFVR